jgi:hypothetical protein
MPSRSEWPATPGSSWPRTDPRRWLREAFSDELLAVTCDSCGEPMVPNVSTLDSGGCGWICLSSGCPELAAGELEAGDLVEAGVPEALAGIEPELPGLFIADEI